MALNNKQYKQAKAMHENADALFTFEHSNGFSFYTSRYMTADDEREMRGEMREQKSRGAFMLDGFNGRACIIPTADGYTLRSYYTDVCAVRGGRFVKTWEGFSVTTLKHVNAFRAFVGLAPLSKREWIEIKTAAA